MNFLHEAVWVLRTYGAPYLAGGLAISCVMVLWGSRRVRRVSRMAFLVAAILVLWLAMIVGVEVGYHSWQTSPNPPEEAFSDTGGPGITLLLGWLPGLVVLGIAHLLLRVIAPPVLVQKAHRSQSINPVNRPDDGNPYQSPGSSTSK